MSNIDGRTALTALIERLEKATGPDRKIDDALHELTPKPRVVEPLKYTRSIDAALTLVPAGFRWLVRNHNGKPTPGGDGAGALAFANVYRDEDEDETDYHSWGKQPAIALCIAALKATGETPR